MNRTSLGLMAFWSDIDEDFVARYREWHTVEHIPERVGIAGFLTGQRYAAIKASRAFFMFYDTASVSVLTSEDYMAALNNPTPWTLESLQHFRNPLRNVYNKLSEHGAPLAEAAPFVTCIRFNAADSQERWDAIGNVLRTLEQHEWTRARFFHVDEDGTGAKTKERDIYGAQIRSQLFLCLLDNAHEALPHTLTTLEAALAERGLADVEVEHYRLEFGMVSSSQIEQHIN